MFCAHIRFELRNADLAIDEDEAEDLLLEIEKQIKKRTWGQAIRLEIEAAADSCGQTAVKDSVPRAFRA